MLVILIQLVSLSDVRTSGWVPGKDGRKGGGSGPSSFGLLFDGFETIVIRPGMASAQGLAEPPTTVGVPSPPGFALIGAVRSGGKFRGQELIVYVPEICLVTSDDE